MNYRNLILIALAFAIALVISPAMAENTYGQVNLHPEINYAQPGAPGFVIFFERGSTVEDHTIWVKNDEQNLTSFDKSFRFDEIKPDAQNAGYGRIIINDDGSSGLIQFAAGNYTAYLQNGNGNQMESQHFQAGAGITTNVVFLGSAIPTHADPAPVTSDTCTNKNIDVTRIVEELVHSFDHQNDYLTIIADYDHLHYNALFTDPDVGTVKELRIVYKWDKHTYGQKWDQHTYYTLDIKSARYGTFCQPMKQTNGYQSVSVQETADTRITH
jgi:hypothetical protein